MWSENIIRRGAFPLLLVTTTTGAADVRACFGNGGGHSRRVKQKLTCRPANIYSAWGGRWGEANSIRGAAGELTMINNKLIVAGMTAPDE